MVVLFFFFFGDSGRLDLVFLDGDKKMSYATAFCFFFFFFTLLGSWSRALSSLAATGSYDDLEAAVAHVLECRIWTEINGARTCTLRYILLTHVHVLGVKLGLLEFDS